jgi:hypothetical protein
MDAKNQSSGRCKQFHHIVFFYLFFLFLLMFYKKKNPTNKGRELSNVSESLDTGLDADARVRAELDRYSG